MRFRAFVIYWHFGKSGSVLEYVLDHIEESDEIRFVGHSYVAADSIKIRDAPSLSASKIALMKKNDVAEVLEVCAKEKIDGIDSAWLRIRTESVFLTNGREWRD